MTKLRNNLLTLRSELSMANIDGVYHLYLNRKLINRANSLNGLTEFEFVKELWTSKKVNVDVETEIEVSNRYFN